MVFFVPVLVVFPYLLGIQVLSSKAGILCIRLGDTCNIPCGVNQEHQQEVEWKHNRDGEEFSILQMGKDGLQKANINNKKKIRLLQNFSLVIEDMNNQHEGNYSCKLCKDNKCVEGPKTSVFLLKESHLNATLRKIAYPGSVFTHSCWQRTAGEIGGLSSVQWTFQATGNQVVTFQGNRRSATETPATAGRFQVLPNASIYLSKVDIRNDGSYSCWRQTGPCDWLRALTIKLTVKTENSTRKPDSDRNVEQTIDTGGQRHIWATAILCVCAVLVLCALILWRYRTLSAVTSASEQYNEEFSSVLYKKSTGNRRSRAESEETESQVYQVLNLVTPGPNHATDNQDECVYSLVKLSSTNDLAL